MIIINYLKLKTMHYRGSWTGEIKIALTKICIHQNIFLMTDELPQLVPLTMCAGTGSLQNLEMVWYLDMGLYGFKTVSNKRGSNISNAFRRHKLMTHLLNFIEK